MEDRKKSQDKAPKKGDSPSSQQYPKPHHPPPTHPQFGDEVDAGIGAGVGLHVAEGLTGKDLDVDVALGISPADEGPVDTKDDFGGLVDDDQLLANQQRWSIRFTLRSHYDSIRAMQFHPLQPVLITASEDGTAKLWDLNAAGSGTGTIKGEGVSKSQIPQPTTGIVDVEPIYTFRGHKGPILAMDMSPTGDMCYTSGFDGSICCWVVPSTAIEIYQNYDPTVLQERLLGHTDAVWAVTYHSSTNRLISASADGTIRLWEPGVGEGMGQSLLRTFTPPAPNSRPRSIDIVSTETQQLLTAYSKANCGILDLETGQNVLTFDFQEGEDGGVGEINKILSHPTMPVTVMAGEDRKIRYFDNNTGKLIHGTVAHVESIGTLAIDPNGLYLLSGSHDGSLRLWNMEKRICLQEIAAHRKKYDMSVMAVAFHPSRPLIGSAGADSLAKVFATSKPSPPFSSPTSSVTSTTSPTSTTTTSYVKSSIAE
ncbi:striatin [Ditylenchus destructor]|uniref:Striatin n=1 Tax=Ditylenchus destructor TaxID=166010 RepID=A0AAD4N3R1_9BILA|nr:striatin [Ditylenchus destructor]